MAIIEIETDIILSNEQRTALKGMVEESVSSNYRTQSEKDLRKEITKRAKDELDIPKKLYNSLVKRAYKRDGDTLNSEITAVLDLAEEIGFYQHNKE
jgi:Transcriptional regulator DsbA